MRYVVKVGYDEGERRYFVLASEIPGLHVETDTFEEFVEVTQDAVPSLIDDIAHDVTIRFERDVVLAA